MPQKSLKDFESYPKSNHNRQKYNFKLYDEEDNTVDIHHTSNSKPIGIMCEHHTK